MYLLLFLISSLEAQVFYPIPYITYDNPITVMNPYRYYIPNIPSQQMLYPNPMLTSNSPISLPFSSIYGNRPPFRRETKDDSVSNEFRDEDGAYEESNSKQSKFVHLLRPKIPPSSLIQNADYLSLINDKDNFHNSGCSYHLFRQKCVDNFGLCKGGCKDFSVSESVPVHDCRCIPYGYAALLKLAGR